MKKILTLLLIMVSISGYSQVGRLPYQTLLQSYRGDTSKTIIGDSVKFETNLPAFNFNKPLFVNGNSIGGSVWTLSGSDIYYNDGNVYIGKSTGTYALDVNGLIGASNIETNETTSSVKLGIDAGYSELTSTEQGNISIGYKSNYELTDGSHNISIGYESGYNVASGYDNIFIGAQSGTATYGIGNTMLGVLSGYSNAGNTNGNIFIGYQSGYYETGSDKLYISSQIYGNEAEGRSKSLMYGVFDADTMNQYVDVNGMVYHTAILAEIYKTGTTVAQSIPTGTTPTKVTAFTTNKYGIHCTADASNDKITITKAGYYDFKLGLSYQIGTSGVTFTAHIFVNGVEDVSLHSTGKPATANDPRSTAVVGTIHVTTVPCDVDYRVTHDNGGSINISFDYCNMAVNYIGE